MLFMSIISSVVTDIFFEKYLSINTYRFCVGKNIYIVTLIVYLDTFFKNYRGIETERKREIKVQYKSI